MTSYLLRSYAVDSDRIRLRVDTDRVALAVDTAVPCGLIISELLSNAIKHAFPEGSGGEIRIDLHENNGEVNLRVSDDGVGLPPDLDVRRTRSLGLQLVSTLVDQLEGTIEMNGKGGTCIDIEFARAR